MRVVSWSSHPDRGSVRYAWFHGPVLAPRSWGLRARVVAVRTSVLLAIALSMSVSALRQFLIAGLDESVDGQPGPGGRAVESRSHQGQTQRPESLYGEDVKSIFTDFTASDVPNVAEGSFFLVDGKPFISRPRGTDRPPAATRHRGRRVGRRRTSPTVRRSIEHRSRACYDGSPFRSPPTVRSPAPSSPPTSWRPRSTRSTRRSG